MSTHLEKPFKSRLRLDGQLDGLAGIFPVVYECSVSINNLLVCELCFRCLFILVCVKLRYRMGESISWERVNLLLLLLLFFLLYYHHSQFIIINSITCA